jgi:hypothetical protein
MTTPDIAGLCERLRAVESSRVHGGFSADCATTHWHRNPAGPEAADTLERQAAEIERLRGALQSLIDNLAEGDFISETRIDAARAALTGEDAARLSLSGKTQTDARTRGD